MADSEGLVTGRPKPITQVPSWFYDDVGLCGLTMAATLWWANVVAMVFHLGLAGATVAVASINGGMGTPVLTTYEIALSWDTNSTRGLIPEMRPTAQGLYLAWLTMTFFLLSAFAHGVVVVCNWRQAFDRTRDATNLSGFYYTWLHRCANPARWLEYGISAAVMACAKLPHVSSLIVLSTECCAVRSNDLRLEWSLGCLQSDLRVRFD